MVARGERFKFFVLQNPMGERGGRSYTSRTDRSHYFVYPRILITNRIPIWVTMFDIGPITSYNLFSFLNTFGDDLLRATISLFAVINPIGTIPLFASMTQKMQKNEREKVLKTTVITASALLMIFAVAGTQILSIFGITISSFMIAGGILLFVVSIELLTHGGWRFGGTISDESGVVPLAFPLLAGPGAITTVILSFQMSGLMVTVLSIAIVMGITYVVFFLTGKIYKILGRRGSLIITRIFAVLIAAIAVQYVVDGLKTM